ncbi:MAG: Tm-1-like ATP-binding domain-containing protein [Pirellulales bacterium]|nr:Tm-1-like ATP-binding domain-containing protein [Pirellulales bacterium]
MAILVFATLDTKGLEAALVCDELRRLGCNATLVDAGCIGEPSVAADVRREELFQAAGLSLTELQSRHDRGTAVKAAAQSATTMARKWLDAGKLDGVISIGGSAGTTIGTSAMRALPLGVPKVMVSTLASGQVRQYVGDKDIFMLNSIVDIAGINRISRLVLSNAAAAMAGMVQARQSGGDQLSKSSDKPLVAATMFGVTTPCVNRSREVLEQAGYEVLVFHATGSGGQAMESLIADGLIAGVLDITTTELADELVGGVLTAGPNRLTVAAKHGVPQLVSVGALDMVNFSEPETVPAKFADRKFYQHNPTITLMRTTVDENRQLGEEIGRKVSVSNGPACVMLPLCGVSALDRAGQPFDDPVARQTLFDGIRDTLKTSPQVELMELDRHINDPAFAEAAATKLLSLIHSRKAC